MHKAIVFDIDGTLTTEIAWPIVTNGLGGSIEVNDYWVRECEASRISLDQMEKKLVENWWTGQRATHEEFYRLCDSVKLRPDARDLVNYLKSKDYILTLITGSFDMYAEIISRKLEIPEWYACSILKWDGDNKLVGLDTVLDDSVRKLELLDQFCKRHNIETGDCVSLGDGDNDVGLFKATGKGIAVRTKFEAKGLENIAWKVVDNLSEVKNIL